MRYAVHARASRQRRHTALSTLNVAPTHPPQLRLPKQRAPLGLPADWRVAAMADAAPVTDQVAKLSVSESAPVRGACSAEPSSAALCAHSACRRAPQADAGGAEELDPVKKAKREEKVRGLRQRARRGDCAG